jgi:hypothetical protein
MAGEINKRIQKLASDLDSKNLAAKAYTFFKNITPYDTRNAQRNTVLSGDEIQANYPYAQRLDNGWSKQNGGKGMTKPTEKFIRGEIKKLGK